VGLELAFGDHVEGEGEHEIVIVARSAGDLPVD